MASIQTMARNAIYYYTQAPPAPQNLPAPVLSTGTGRTGPIAGAGYAAILPGYVSDPNYVGNAFDYAPPDRENRFFRPPMQGIGQGVDGLAALNPTQRAHEFAVASYTQSQFRSAPYWQIQSFGPDFRLLLERQQVARYRNFNQVLAARPLSQADYFAGYTTPLSTSATIGASNFGYLGNN